MGSLLWPAFRLLTLYRQEYRQFFFYSSEQTLLTGLEAVSILDSIILGIPLWL